jgi:hypothetical protein
VGALLPLEADKAVFARFSDGADASLAPLPTINHR